MVKRAAIVGLTIIVILAIVVVFSAIARVQFNRETEEKVEDLFRGNNDRTPYIIQLSDLERLPGPVQKWLEGAGLVGQEEIKSARMLQEAEIRLNPGGRWMTLNAQQYIAAEPPGFIWQARINAAPLIHISGRDVYKDGRGNMLIKPLSIITIADETGFQIDQGTLVRYLAEMVWIPTVAVSNFVSWESIDENSARAIMRYGNIRVSGVFNFNEQGDPVSFSARRFGEFNGQFRMETWSVIMSDHREFDGFRIPSSGKITWELEEGDFTWYKFKVKELEFNKPEVF